MDIKPNSEVAHQIRTLYEDGYSIDFSYKAINVMLENNYLPGNHQGEHIPRSQVREFLRNVDNVSLNIREQNVRYVREKNKENIKQRRTDKRIQTLTRNRENGLLYRITHDEVYFNRIGSP